MGSLQSADPGTTQQAPQPVKLSGGWTTVPGRVQLARSSLWREHHDGCEDRCRSRGGVPAMVEVGDRIRLSSMKGPGRGVSSPRSTGSLVRVRWLSGDETMVAPAPGTLQRARGGQGRPSKGAGRCGQEHGRRDEEEHRQHRARRPRRAGRGRPRGRSVRCGLIGRGKWSADARFGDPRSLIWWVPSRRSRRGSSWRIHGGVAPDCRGGGCADRSVRSRGRSSSSPASLRLDEDVEHLTDRAFLDDGFS